MQLLKQQSNLQIHRSPIMDALKQIEDKSIDAAIALFPPPQSCLYPYLSHVVKVGRELQRVLKDPSAFYLLAQDYQYQPTAKRDEAMGNRYAAKREVGISATRKDGSECDKENDILAAAAERLVVERLGRRFDSAIHWHGDSADCYLHGAKVDIKLRRRDGADIDLLINPDDKPKHIYILVTGTKLSNLTVWGYTTHDELLTNRKLNLGYGKKLAMHCTELHPLDDLLALTAHPKPGEFMMLPSRIATRLQSDGWWLHGYNNELFLLSPSRYLPYWAKYLNRDSIAQQIPPNSKVLVFADEQLGQVISQASEVILVQQ